MNAPGAMIPLCAGEPAGAEMNGKHRQSCGRRAGAAARRRRVQTAGRS